MLNKNGRKSVLRSVLASAACLAVLSACSTAGSSSGEPASSSTDESGTSTSSPGSESSSEPASPAVSVNVQLMNHPWTDELIKKIPDFEKATGIKVNYTALPEQQLTEQYNVKLNAGSDEFDVLLYRTAADGPVFRNNEWLADLTDYAKQDAEFDLDDFSPGPIDLNSKDGRLYGVPILVENSILYYNKEILDKYGIEVPNTLDELKAAAKKVSEAGDGIYGFVARGAANAAVSSFSPFLFSFGGDFDDGAGTATVDTPEAVDAYEYYGGMLRDYGPPGTADMSWPEASAVFATGKAAFYADADGIAATILDPASSSVTDKVGYAMFPEGPAGRHPYSFASWAIGVNEFSNQKDAAWQFVAWATSKDVFVDEMKAGNLSPRQSTWDVEGISQGSDQELFDIRKESMKIGVGHVVPVVANVGRARDFVGQPYVVAQQGGDVKAAADEANAEYQKILDSEK